MEPGTDQKQVSTNCALPAVMVMDTSAAASSGATTEVAVESPRSPAEDQSRSPNGSGDEASKLDGDSALQAPTLLVTNTSAAAAECSAFDPVFGRTVSGSVRSGSSNDGSDVRSDPCSDPGPNRGDRPVLRSAPPTTTPHSGCQMPMMVSGHGAPPLIDEAQAAQTGPSREDDANSLNSVASSVRHKFPGNSRRPRREEEVRCPESLSSVLQSLITRGQELQGLMLDDGYQALRMAGALEQKLSMLKTENAYLRRQATQNGPEQMFELAPIRSESCSSGFFGSGAKNGTPGSSKSFTQRAPQRKQNRSMTDPAKIRSLREELSKKDAKGNTASREKDKTASPPPAPNRNHKSMFPQKVSWNKAAPSNQQMESKVAQKVADVTARDSTFSVVCHEPRGIKNDRQNVRVSALSTGSAKGSPARGSRRSFGFMKSPRQSHENSHHSGARLSRIRDDQIVPQASTEPNGLRNSAGGSGIQASPNGRNSAGGSGVQASPNGDDERSKKTRLPMPRLPVAVRRLSNRRNSKESDAKASHVRNEENFKERSTQGSVRSSGATAGTSAGNWLVEGLKNPLTSMTRMYKESLIGSVLESPVKFRGSVASMNYLDEEIEPNEEDEFYEFTMLDIWVKRKNSCHDVATPRLCKGRTMMEKRSKSNIEAESATADEKREVHTLCSKFMIRPSSFQRVLWDMLSTSFIAYDGIMTPMMFFDLDQHTFTTMAGWMVRIFWTLDIPFTVVTGFTRFDGDLEMRPQQIVLRYLRTWFFLDVLVVGSDWAEVFIKTDDYAAGGSAARLSKVIRIMRVIRMVRLLRVGRLPQIMERLSAHIPMQVNFFIRAAANVLKIMGIILLLAHCIACFWYATADGRQHDDNWIRANNLQDSGTIYLYLTAFHWSLTQFSGSMEVAPRNEVERLLAVITLLFSFMVSNVFVSSLTSSMTRFHMVSSRQTKMFAELRRYLERNHISTKLAIRLNIHAAHVFKEQQRNIDECDIEMLQFVSEALMMDLHYEIYSRWCACHPFFEKCLRERPLLMRRICHQACKMHRFMAGDVIFSSGEAPEPPMMFVNVSGTLHYRRDEEFFFFGEEEHDMAEAETRPPLRKNYSDQLEELDHINSDGSHMLESGSWLCESPLWVSWTFLGELRAFDCVQVMTLEADSLHMIAERYGEMPIFCKYAAKYKDLLSHVPVSEMSEIGSNSIARRAVYEIDFDSEFG